MVTGPDPSKHIAILYLSKRFIYSLNGSLFSCTSTKGSCFNELKREIKTLKRKLTDCLIAYDKATSYEDDPYYNAY